MRKMLPVSLRIILWGSAALFFSGCAAIVIGGASAGGVAYVLGEMKADLDATPADLAKAIDRAGDRLKLIRISGEGDELTGEYVYRTADDRKVVIKYERITDHTTNLKIRVGTIGDQVLSQKVLEAIREALR